MLDRAYRTARRAIIAVVGSTLIAAGVAMLVLPGPAVVVLPAGLAVLGIEFAWARRWLRRLRAEARRRTGLGSPGSSAEPPHDPDRPA